MSTDYRLRDIRHFQKACATWLSDVDSLVILAREHLQLVRRRVCPRGLIKDGRNIFIRSERIVVREPEGLGTDARGDGHAVVRRTMTEAGKAAFILGTRILAVHHQKVRSEKMALEMLGHAVEVLVVRQQDEDLAGRTLLKPIGDCLFRMVRLQHLDHQALVQRILPAGHRDLM